MNTVSKKQHALQLLNDGNLTEAKALFEELCANDPGDGESRMQLVSICAGTGDMAGAEKTCRELIALYPSSPEPYLHLSTALLFQTKKQEATEVLQRALKLQPDSPAILFNLGKAWQTQARFTEALQCYEKVLVYNPDAAQVFDSMGSIYKSRGQTGRAIELYRKSVEVRPDFAPGHSDLVFAYCYSPDYDPGFIYREHLRWGECHTLPASARKSHATHDRDPGKRLRVGYVSPDFYLHSVAYFFEPLLEHRDRDRYEIFCYADLRKFDEVTGRLKSLSDHWSETQGLSDQQLADLIHADGIDILIDLTGHTANSRLRIFSARPAPVQVSYLGYPNTTGLKQMDYRITDSDADPEGCTEQWHTETLTRLDGGFLCYRPKPDAPPVTETPLLENGFITFGSFNNLAKIVPAVVEVWSMILAQIPDSRLIIKNIALCDDATRELYWQQFEAFDINRERVDLRRPVYTTDGHLEAYGDIDIALDTFPYNGTATTCEALWMGVPVVTLAGTTHVGRVGASLMRRVGLNELVAEESGQYVEVALALARDPDRMVRVRAGLRETMRASQLCDGKRIMTELESAYRQMWETWCDRAAVS